MSDEPHELFDQEPALARDGAAGPDEGEVLDGVPVLADGHARAIEPLRPPGALSPVVQTAAIVGVSVVAGAATVAIVHRRKARRLSRRRRRMIAPVLLSRSFLVDVHVLGERK